MKLSRILFIFIWLCAIFTQMAIAYPIDYQNNNFELALSSFEKGEFEKAKMLFSSLTDSLSKLYLARICLNQGDFSEAEKILTQASFKSYEEAYYERLYLLGILYFKENKPDLAAECFAKALPSPKAPWHNETLYYLGWSYFKLSRQKILQPALKQNYLEKAAACFQQSLNGDASLFSLAQVYLAQGNGQKAAAVLQQFAPLIREGRSELAELFRLAASPSLPHTFPGWILYALKEFESQEFALSQQALDQALASSEDEKQALDILSWKALIALRQKSENELYTIKNQADTHAEASQVYYLIGLVAAKLMQSENNPLFAEIALAALQKGTPDEQTLHLKGIVHYQAGHFLEAGACFASLSPGSPFAGEALYWSARCREKLGHDPKELLAQVAAKYPESKYAPEASFHLYSYRDYMQGGRQAIKHLQNFTGQYPSHPLALTAFYLLGIDLTRDRKSPEGKWIRKKNLHEAIDCFEKLEKAYAGLSEEEKPKALFHQTLFEKGSLYLKMAEESQGAKKQIFLQYAEETFRNLCKAPLEAALKEECAYWLAKTLSAAGEDQAAQKVLGQLLKESPQHSKAWFEQGMIAARRSDFESALQNYIRAEQTAFALSPDERLEILIEQSQCYKMLNNLSQAMLTLSQVINDDAISGLRLKAMYLRSEIYEKQGRFELARKQLEATAKKGGEWGGKAISKLERDYGY